jgi:hypothetical protein
MRKYISFLLTAAVVAAPLVTTTPARAANPEVKQGFDEALQRIKDQEALATLKVNTEKQKADVLANKQKARLDIQQAVVTTQGRVQELKQLARVMDVSPSAKAAANRALEEQRKEVHSDTAHDTAVVSAVIAGTSGIAYLLTLQKPIEQNANAEDSVLPPAKKAARTRAAKTAVENSDAVTRSWNNLRGNTSARRVSGGIFILSAATAIVSYAVDYLDVSNINEQADEQQRKSLSLFVSGGKNDALTEGQIKEAFATANKNDAFGKAIVNEVNSALTVIDQKSAAINSSKDAIVKYDQQLASLDATYQQQAAQVESREKAAQSR